MKIKRVKFLFSVCFIILNSSFGQKLDTLKQEILSPITIEAQPIRHDILRIDPIHGTYLLTGKKNEVISLKAIDANITERTGRQLFAKVPGIFVYDMEGGNQLNISSRGLDPHRGWEFNQRKDGALSNSDLYAYPASHYSIPMESVERIEFVRGTSSLQYGSQFGGMLNFITKQGDTTKPVSFESFNTVGSFNLLSAYNAIGGKINKIKYYAYYAKRSRDGYRTSEHTDYDAQGINFTYEPNSKLSFRLDWVRSNYIYRIPGPLTDSMFAQDPRLSTRSRSYFNPAINIPSLTIKWDINENTRFTYVSSAVVGLRSSVTFDKPATIKDSINPLTLEYSNRQVDIDAFNSYTQELRLLHTYRISRFKNNLAIGAQVLTNNLHRKQLGIGSTGTDFDLTLVKPGWGRDMHYRTNNFALYAENSFNLTKDFMVNIGARWEVGESDMTGHIVYYPDDQFPVSVKRNYPLFGANFTYKLIEKSEFYGGFSQTYRAMLLKDLVPNSTFEHVDPNIKDADGYNAEIGYRGNFHFLSWDISCFMLQYNNRFGTLSLTDENGNFYTYRTNTGNSNTKGIEAFIQGMWNISNHSQISVFTSTSIMNGRYTSGNLKSGNQNIELKGNKIETVPDLISRNGVTYSFKGFSLSALLSYVSQSYADALNTEKPNAAGSVGLVPAYTIVDLNSTFRFSNHIEIRASLNNVLDRQYFTKRPSFYPGPGIWTSDGRSMTASLIFRI
ncbi:MAG: TonB-dependent receptor [Saprospiraceae bacterium]|nr:TonB-dependent receptor [Saprospiraceae bacterium]